MFCGSGVTNPSTSQSFYYELHGVTPPPKTKGGPPARQDRSVIAAQALSAKSNVKAMAWIADVSLQTSGVYDQVEKLSTGATGVDWAAGD